MRKIAGTHRICREQSGSTIVEFAIVLPVFFFLVMAIIEIGLIGFSSIVVENAMNTGLRRAKVDVLAPGVTREDYIRQQIRDSAFGLIDPGKIYITNRVLNPADYDEIGPELCANPAFGSCLCPPGEPWIDRNSNGACDIEPNLSAGIAGEIMNYTVVYRWRVLTPMLPVSSLFSPPDEGVNIADEDGNVLLVSGGAVRNERF